MIKAVIFDMFETLVTHYRAPLYFGAQMAADAGIDTDRFREMWHPTENDRSLGKVTVEAVLEMIFSRCGVADEDLLSKIMEKRKAAKRRCFENLHSGVMPMLRELRGRGILTGLISNCFSEEAEVIRESELMPMFDSAMLSYEQGVMKPDREIFLRCVAELGVKAEECLYIGDGGSGELEAARAFGMTALQAAWYFIPGAEQLFQRKEGFIQLEDPMDVVKYL